jgi:hypothetical protein
VVVEDVLVDVVWAGVDVVTTDVVTKGSDVVLEVDAWAVVVVVSCIFEGLANSHTAEAAIKSSTRTVRTISFSIKKDNMSVWGIKARVTSG